MTVERLAGKVAVITGAGSGLGAASCVRFSAEGAAVVVADVNAESAAQVVAEIRNSGGNAVACEVDVRDEGAVESMIATAREVHPDGRVDVLYCNAGVPAVGTAGDCDRRVWDDAIAVMLTGTWLSMRAVLPAMQQQGEGSIIVQASVAGLTGVKALAPYSAAKGGAISLVRQAAADYARFGIRVNAICPGMIPTPLTRATIECQVAAGLKSPRTYEEGLERAAENYPLGRLGTPDDVANLALFLASDESGWVTGQTFTVDGGLTAG